MSGLEVVGLVLGITASVEQFINAATRFQDRCDAFTTNPRQIPRIIEAHETLLSQLQIIENEHRARRHAFPSHTIAMLNLRFCKIRENLKAATDKLHHLAMCHRGQGFLRSFMFAKSTRSMCKRLEGGLRFVQGVIDDLFSYQMMHVVVENVCDSHVDAITRGMEGVMIRKVDQRVQESISRCMADVVSKMAPPQRMPKSCLLPKSMVRQYVSLHYLPLLNSLMHWMYLRFLNRHLDSMQREERWYIDSWWDSIQAENVQYVQYITVPRIRRNAQNGVLQYDSECESEFSEDNDDADEDAGESDEEMDEFYVGRDGSDVDSGGSDDSGHREVSHNSLSPCWFCTCIGRNVEYFWRQLEYKFVPQGFETPKSIEKYGMPHERRFNISTFAGAGGIYIIDLEDATGIMDVSYQLARIVHESGGVVESSFIRDENNLYLCVARVVEWFRGRKCVFIVAGLGICRCNNEWVSELRNLTKCGRGSVMFLTTSRPAK